MSAIYLFALLQAQGVGTSGRDSNMPQLHYLRGVEPRPDFGYSDETPIQNKSISTKQVRIDQDE